MRKVNCASMASVARVVVVLGAFVTMPLAAWAEPPLHDITDLGTLGGSYSIAYGVNDYGQVVGCSYTTPGSGFPRHAFVWEAGKPMQDLGTLGGDWSYGYAINTSGQGVGATNNASNEVYGFLWEPGAPMQDLGHLGNNWCAAADINEDGLVVGYSNSHPFLWQPGMPMQDLGTLGGTPASATAINDYGQVVGSSKTSTGEQHAFLWEAGVPMQDLGTLGGNYSYAYDINNYAQVVGEGSTAASPYQAFFCQAGAPMQNLGTLGGEYASAKAINDYGQVVGYSTTAIVGITHAFFWEEGTLYDLNDFLTPSSSSWVLGNAMDISSEGNEFGAYIVGIGYNPDGQTHAFLATPTPEPASVFLLLLGAPVAYWARHRKES